MKQLLISLAFVSGIFSFVSAQSTFKLEPAHVQTQAPSTQYDTEAHVNVINLTNANASIRWDRTIIEIGQGCETQVCDPVACFASWINTHTFTLGALDTAQLIVHMLNNNGNDCCAIVHLRVSNLSVPSGVDSTTAVYLFNTCASSGTNGLLPQPNVKVYPNPVVDYLTLENAGSVGHIRVYDLSGKLVSYLSATSDSRYDVSALKTGSYILAFEDERGNIFQVAEIVK